MFMLEHFESCPTPADCTFVLAIKDAFCIEEEFFPLFSVVDILLPLSVIYRFDIVFPMIVVSNMESTCCPFLQVQTATFETNWIM